MIKEKRDEETEETGRFQETGPGHSPLEHISSRQGVWGKGHGPETTPTWTYDGRLRSPPDRPAQPTWVGLGRCPRTHQEGFDAGLRAVLMGMQHVFGERIAIFADLTATIRIASCGNTSDAPEPSHSEHRPSQHSGQVCP